MTAGAAKGGDAKLALYADYQAAAFQAYALAHAGAASFNWCITFIVSKPPALQVGMDEGE